MNRALATFVLRTLRFFRAQIPVPRRERVFGQELRLTPDTIFPNHWRYQLPSQSGRPTIVRYSDYVQFCSVCDYLANLTHPPVVVDVGAFHGAYAVTLGMFCKPHGRLIAVEPSPDSFRILDQNVRLNDLSSIVSTVEAAVSDSEGTASFASEGIFSHISSDQVAGGVAQVGSSVKVTTLRSLLSGYGIQHVDLLMIDIEGAELPALRAFPWESVTFGRMMCELHPYNWKLHGYTWNDFQTFLSEHDLRCLDMYLRDFRSAKESPHYIGPCLMWKP